MPTPDTNKPRKRRQKATTELGRQMMQRERQKLAREQAALAEKMVNEARAVRENQRPIVKAPRQQVGINRSIVRRVAAALASEGVNVPIKCEPAQGAQQMSAWTDFHRIAVRYVAHDDVRLLAATLRGLLYHEGGHIVRTIPFLDLAAMAGVEINRYTTDPLHRALHRAWNCLEDQRMETAVVSDSPRKAAYFTPLVMTTHTATLDMMAANWPLLVWRRFLPSKLRAQARAMFITRHNLVGKDGNALARELDRVVTKYVLATDAFTMWDAVGEMLVVLTECQPLASNMDDAGHDRQQTRELPKDFKGLTIPVDPKMLDDGVCEDPGPDLDPPTSSTDLQPEELEHLLDILIAAWNAPETLIEVRHVVNQSQPTPSKEDGEEDGEEQGEPGDEQGEEQQGTPGGLLDQERDTAEAPDMPQGSEGDQDAAGEDDPGEGGDSGAHDRSKQGDDKFTQDDLNELLQEAERERNNDHALDNDIREYHDAINNGVTDLDVYTGGIEQNGELIAQAESLAHDIEDAFHAHTMDRAPAWVEQQRRGVLNVGRYMARNPGDTEFFRQWTEDDAPGFDIAVSVMLDYSGSMGHHVAKLAQAGYACKLACQNLNIPCTVTLWDTGALTLWDANEYADHMPTIEANGGTVPDLALSDLDNQRCDRAKHIVLIMTDGQWQGRWKDKNGGSLAFYKDAGRSIVGFGFGGYNLAATMMGYGCDEAYATRDLMDIPHFLEQALLELA